MAGLYERIANTGETSAPEDAKLPVHTFMAGIREVARGNATLAQLASVFNLDATAQAELQAIADTYASLQNQQQDDFKTLLHDAFLLAEAGIYDKATVKNRLGF